MAELRIRCPKCSWRPDGTARWECGCGHGWNVFATQGRCPGCGLRMAEVHCQDCCVRSELLQWYEDLHGVLDELLADEQVPTWLRYGDVR